MSRSKAVLTILMVLGLGVFATGCGGDDSSSQEQQVEQREQPEPQVVRSYEFFSSPTENIGCSMSDEGVRCDVRQASWNPPPKPANCPLDWGQGVSVGDGEAGYVCAGDTTLGGTTTLRYGESSKVGDFICESSEAGMRCENTSTGHGFELSRSAVNLF